jgi:hypothetical protein
MIIIIVILQQHRYHQLAVYSGRTGIVVLSFSRASDVSAFLAQPAT